MRKTTSLSQRCSTVVKTTTLRNMPITARQRAATYALRSTGFAKVAPRHLEHLQRVLDTPCSVSHRRGKLLTDADAIEPFNRDWLQQVEGCAPAVLLPTCASQVSEILRYCQAERLAVVPQSGNTGLVYGSGPLHDELVLSLRGMNAAPVVTRDTMSVEAEAGVTLQECHDACQAHGMLFPLSMGSKGSAMIGGNVSTNAGGIHYARYGSMHANVLGIEVVTAQGQVLNLRSSLRKDNAGYDLKHLFIGSEGTLGVVTRAVVRLYPQPKSQQLALFWLPDFESVLVLYHLSQEHLAECLSAFEVMDGESLSLFAPDRLPYVQSCKSDVFRRGTDFTAAYFCVLVETNGSNASHDFEKLGGFVEAVEKQMGDKLSGADGREPILSQSKSQTQQLWSIRENIPIEHTRAGDFNAFDISFKLNEFYDLVEYTRELLYKQHHFDPDVVIVSACGHFGDGNVHLIVTDLSRTHGEALERALYPAIYEFCVAKGGSISAEHGVGVQKRDQLHLSRTPEAIELMREMKHMMDPNGILNPYKVFHSL